MIKVSVIIPCYNVEGYVKEAVHSVLNQTFQDFEIICLDDGSTDGTLQVLKEIEASDKKGRIRVVTGENRRQAYERNQGIQMAKGKYLYFMDADDRISEDCLRVCYERLEKEQLDILYFEGETFYEGEDLEEKYPQYKTMYNRKKEYPGVYIGKELYVQLQKTKGDYVISPCMQIIRGEFLKESGITFPELPLMEDNVYTVKTMLAAKRVGCITAKLYQRRVRRDSTMTERSDKWAQNRLYCYVYIINTIMELSEQYREDDAVHQTLMKHIDDVNGRMCRVIATQSEMIYDTVFEDEYTNHMTVDNILPVLFHYYEKCKKLKQDKNKLKAKIQQLEQEIEEKNE